MNHEIHPTHKSLKQLLLLVTNVICKPVGFSLIACKSRGDEAQIKGESEVCRIVAGHSEKALVAMPGFRVFVAFRGFNRLFGNV
jgi:hypothetical protein